MVTNKNRQCEAIETVKYGCLFVCQNQGKKGRFYRVDLISMEYVQQNVLSKIKSLKPLKIQNQGEHRFVVSVLKIIECIHKEYPSLEIQNVA